MNTKEQLVQIIEGILFIYGDEGVSLSDLQTVLENEKPSAIKQAIEALEMKYAKDSASAFSIQKFGTTKYRLQTKPELHPYFSKLENIQTQSKLSASAIEVLAVIAYKGPITKSEIDEIRGSDSAYQVAKLKDRHLIRSVGLKAETRANLYTITENFFKLFNLTGGKETLPPIDETKIKNNLEPLNETKTIKGKDIFGNYDQQIEEFGDNH